MKALIISDKSHQQIDKIAYQDIAKPNQIADDEVLIKVHSVGLNPVDYKIVEFGIEAWTYPHVLGLDMAGVVEQVGKDVSHLAVGDRVCGHGDLTQNGCFAEYAVTKGYCLTQIPDNVRFEQAAAVLCGAMTAYQALFRKASLTNRHSVLIHAGAGGVGAIAVQLAKRHGLTVYATASTGKIDFVKSLGADVVIDYKANDVSEAIKQLTQGLGVDLIINTVSKTEATKDLHRLAYNGALVSIVSPAEMDDQSSLVFSKGLSMNMVNLGGAHGSHNPTQQQDLATIANELLTLVSKGELDPLVTEIITLEEIPTALARIKAGKTMGKVVATVNTPDKASTTA